MKKWGKALTIFLVVSFISPILHQTIVKAFTVRPAYIQWDLHYKQKKDDTIVISDWNYNSAKATIEAIKLKNYSNPSNIDFLKVTANQKENNVYINVKANIQSDIPAGTYYYAIKIAPSPPENSTTTASIQGGAQIIAVINVIPNNQSLEKNLQNKLTTNIAITKPKIPILFPYTISVTITNKSPFVIKPTAAMKIILQNPSYDFYSKRIDLSTTPLLPHEKRVETFKVKIWKTQTFKFSKAIVKAKVYNKSGKATDTSQYEIKRPLLFLILLALIIAVVVSYPLIYIIKRYKKNKLLKNLIYTPNLQKIIKK